MAEGIVAQPPLRSAASTAALSREEIAGILFMREEEKLARDAYLTLAELWSIPIFDNIAASESSHMAAVATLISAYGLDDPAAGKAQGEFTDPSLQSLYDELVAQGEGSLVEALRVGAIIEEMDILDLESRIAATENEDILRVCGNLLRGSHNHLRAFVSNLERRTGEVYQPLYLDVDALAAILE